MRPTVALTFDDGPSDDTVALLHVLGEHVARATFFVLGCQIAGREHILQKAVRAGHEIGLHGWDHTRLDELDEEQLAVQLGRTRHAVRDACGATPVLWRSPWHITPDWAAETLTAAGLRVCGADLDVKDTRQRAPEIALQIRQALREGLIVGLHDGAAPNGETPRGSRAETVRAVARILPLCRSVTLSTLVGAPA